MCKIKLLTLFLPFMTNVVCSLICLCTLVKILISTVFKSYAHSAFIRPDLFLMAFENFQEIFPHDGSIFHVIRLLAEDYLFAPR